MGLFVTGTPSLRRPLSRYCCCATSRSARALATVSKGDVAGRQALMRAIVRWMQVGSGRRSSGIDSNPLHAFSPSLAIKTALVRHSSFCILLLMSCTSAAVLSDWWELQLLCLSGESPLATVGSRVVVGPCVECSSRSGVAFAPDNLHFAPLLKMKNNIKNNLKESSCRIKGVEDSLLVHTMYV